MTGKQYLLRDKFGPILCLLPYPEGSGQGKEDALEKSLPVPCFAA
jgi:hypothetical protein